MKSDQLPQVMSLESTYKVENEKKSEGVELESELAKPLPRRSSF